MVVHVPATVDPLYVRGRRRACCNKWGYDPTAPDLLEPAEHVKFKKRPPAAIVAARRHWASLQVWAGRRDIHPELNRRRRRQFGQVVLVEPPNPKRKPRGDWRRWIHRACQVIAEHASALADGLTGQWVGSKFVGFLSRHQWAKLVGCKVKIWDLIVERLLNAAWIKPRRQRRRKFCDHQQDAACTACVVAGRVRFASKIASFCVTDAFWHASRAWGAVLRFREDIEKKAAKAARKTQGPAPELHGSSSPHAPSPSVHSTGLTESERTARRMSWQNAPPTSSGSG